MGIKRKRTGKVREGEEKIEKEEKRELVKKTRRQKKK